MPFPQPTGRSKLGLEQPIINHTGVSVSTWALSSSMTGKPRRASNRAPTSSTFGLAFWRRLKIRGEGAQRKLIAGSLRWAPPGFAHAAATINRPSDSRKPKPHQRPSWSHQMGHLRAGLEPAFGPKFGPASAKIKGLDLACPRRQVRPSSRQCQGGRGYDTNKR